MTVLGKFFKWVSVTFFNLKKEAKILVPPTINVVEAIKKWMDNPSSDKVIATIETLIPGKTDDTIIDFVHIALHRFLPLILLKLKSMNELLAMSPDEIDKKLIDALNELKFSSPENKTIFYTGFSALIFSKYNANVDYTTAFNALQDYYKAYNIAQTGLSISEPVDTFVSTYPPIN